MRTRMAAVVVVAAVALALTVLLALTDGAVVRAPEEVRSVAFGRPFPWLVQSQPLDPPLPSTLAPMTPLDARTDVLVVPLLQGWAVWAAALAAAAAGAVRLRRRRT